MGKGDLWQAFKAALPVCAGYVALGLPCGILGAAAGMNLPMVLILSVVMYSGSGQYMIPNMFLAGYPIPSLSASVTLVSSRQLLYSSALAPFFKGVSKFRIFWFAATVTDESFGVNMNCFQAGIWTPARAQAVNTYSHLFWTAANCLGVLLGTWLVIDTAIASFAMTSIFLCLLLIQRFASSHVVACVASVAGVVICKMAGLSGIAILAGSLIGMAAGVVAHSLENRRDMHAIKTGGDEDTRNTAIADGTGEGAADDGVE